MEETTVIQPRPFGSVEPGTRLNGIYQIEKMIAQGGMGEVYRGFNVQTADIVAIKMIRPEFSDNDEIMELFRREASILPTWFMKQSFVIFFFGRSGHRARLSRHGVRRRPILTRPSDLGAAVPA